MNTATLVAVLLKQTWRVCEHCDQSHSQLLFNRNATTISVLIIHTIMCFHELRSKSQFKVAVNPYLTEIRLWSQYSLYTN